MELLACCFNCRCLTWALIWIIYVKLQAHIHLLSVSRLPTRHHYHRVCQVQFRHGTKWKTNNLPNSFSFRRCSVHSHRRRITDTKTCSGSRTIAPHWISIGYYSVLVSCLQLFTFHSFGGRVQSGLSTQHIIFDTLKIGRCRHTDMNGWVWNIVLRVHGIRHTKNNFNWESWRYRKCLAKLSRY